MLPDDVFKAVTLSAIALSSTSLACSEAGEPVAGSEAHPSLANTAARVGRCAVFPPDNPWNQDISTAAVHPDSDRFIDAIGRDEPLHADFGSELDGEPLGIPYVNVSDAIAPVPIEFTRYGYQSDPGPYPIPPNAPVEGGPDADGDRHVIVVETTHCMLYELYRAFLAADGNGWQAESGAVFDLKTNAERPLRWTSADAAGLPILPGLVRYNEVVERGEIRHALRFTVSQTQAAYVAPARHYASGADDPALPPMGLRVRMKGDYDCSSLSSVAQVICAGLKRYGMFVADNGSDWYLSGAHDARWDDGALEDLREITGDAFEVVDTGPVQTY
jgi:hypothetical protein